MNQHSHHCFHCGEPVPGSLDLRVTIFGKPEMMCCLGCQAVAEQIIELGLTDYYRHRTGFPAKPEELVPEQIRELVFSKRIAKLAADLMKVDGVRLYHDQALFKEAGGGITPWHADQYYWPLSSDKTVTAWIPLQETPLELGPLEFSAGSHQIVEGRDLSISDESEKILSEKLRVSDFPHVVEAFDVGEVSFHSGWVFHRAGANNSELTRKVMTVIYMDKDMVLKKPENKNQIKDWNTWCPGAKVGEVIQTELNPVIL